MGARKKNQQPQDNPRIESFKYRDEEDEPSQQGQERPLCRTGTLEFRLEGQMALSPTGEGFQGKGT